jgi:hypothetical protein
MEEEWMRDRALLRDLLQKTPQASPRELAQAIGRSVSWVKKWRKRLAEGDPHDPSLVCSCSRAHHAPYLRWDVRVTQKIVEMRLGLVPCSTIFPVTQSCKQRTSRCRAPVERTGAILHATGCLVTRSKESPHSNELREPLEEIQMDARSMLVLFRLNKARKASASTWSRSVMRVDAGTSIALSAQAREDFHEPARTGSGDRLLAPRFSLAVASAPVMSGDYASCLPAASTR